MASLPDLLGGSTKQYRSILALQVTSSQTLVAPCDGLVDLSVIGGGGSGGLYVQTGMAPTAAFGGGAGGFARRLSRIKKGDVIVVTIGAGGAYVTNANAAGNSGGASSIVIAAQAVNMVANGGTGGYIYSGTGVALAGAPGGSATGGQINSAGGRGGGILNTNWTGQQVATGGGGVNLFGGADQTATAGGDIVFAIATVASWVASGGGGVFSAGQAMNNGSLSQGGNGGSGFTLYSSATHQADLVANWGLVPLPVGGGGTGGYSSGGSYSAGSAAGDGGGSGGVNLQTNSTPGGFSVAAAGAFGGGGAISGSPGGGSVAYASGGTWGGGGGGLSSGQGLTAPNCRSGAGGSGLAFLRFFADLTP
ncbi:glycine-rich domain-containing protein [Curvibacter gracilis]|uniref:glycine-rich domain-containing protein n=1 Tax=Curvibacter gracilis TaxID=230310 RepID=UPI0004812192|nr:hypothetical protein [Curvibacter gracilis]